MKYRCPTCGKESTGPGICCKVAFQLIRDDDPDVTKKNTGKRSKAPRRQKKAKPPKDAEQEVVESTAIETRQDI